MDRILSRGSLAMVFGIPAIAIAVAGCDAGSASVVREEPGILKSESKPGEDLAAQRLPGWYEGERPVLRFQMDAERKRLWVLTANGVALYDANVRQKLAQVSLPDWLWVKEPFGSCPPDLALGPKGEAVVSSNVAPMLWRIDPATFAATKLEPVLDEDTGQDVGFSALAYSEEQGTFFAASAGHGSLWRIDPLFRRAQKVGLSAPIPRACGLAVRSRAPNQRASRFVGLCVRSDRQDWTINLAPDQRSGYVSSVQCTAVSWQSAKGNGG